MKAPSIIKDRIEHFRRNYEACHSPLYNETQLRREFVDPFFEALGWDVFNKQGFAEAYKEVVHEDAIRLAEGTKAPDYCFRIGGTRKFFVEAKKPAVNIKEDPSPAFQLRRYAWSAKLPLSILTDFEEFAVYDCRIRPHQTDKASAARLILLTYEEYIEKWEEIASIFSHDAVLKSFFDKYAESTRRRGTAEVDDAFLAEIETWRKELAQNFALRNERLMQRELNFAVERTIDRIIFLRVCEDRGIEPYGQLRDLIAGRNIYVRLFEIFRRADDRYNSGLFHFQKETGRAEAPDELTPTLTLDDKPLKDIIQGLYYPDSPYEFSVLSADILGQVYEQFLGKVIRLTEGHRAKVEDKPEVKKAGGVYYTPTYIVDYIVKHTVGKLLEGKTPKEAAKLRILDPACGSGSFLIGAYQYLLNWYLEQYLKVGPRVRGDLTPPIPPASRGEKENLPPFTGGQKGGRSRAEKRLSPRLRGDVRGVKSLIYQTTGGQWRLTPAERKRILLNNIYGVDIDPQAVEVTKLSLLLKVLEGESSESLNAQLKMFRQRALPDLGSNIKCGNSLIGPDFYDHTQTELLDDEEQYRINAFDWNAEFADIMKAGGFDAVIGNPPYLNLTHGTISDEILEYYNNYYQVLKGAQSKNLFSVFIERGLRVLRQNGYFSFIVPEGLTRTRSYASVRRLAYEQAGLESLLLFDRFVFKEAMIGSVVFVFRKGLHPESYEVNRLQRDGSLTGTLHLRHNDIGTSQESLWKTSAESPADLLVAKLGERFPRVGESFTFYKGMIVKNRERHLRKTRKKGDLPFLLGNCMDRYRLEYKHYARYEDLEIIGGTKLLSKHVQCPRLLVRRTGDHLCVTFTDEPQLVESTLYIVTGNTHEVLLYLLGNLNSSLHTFLVRQRMITNPQAYPQILMTDLLDLPIRPINFSYKKDKARHDKMVSLVERMLKLHKELPKAKTPDEKTRLERQIAATDKQIDSLVYELYGLTEEEIKIVEGE